MFVPILVLMLLGIVLTHGVRKLEEMFAPWKDVD
jgi:ABC-type nitrate/sulfonate/bicarbonate transport system permease component